MVSLCGAMKGEHDRTRVSKSRLQTCGPTIAKTVTWCLMRPPKSYKVECHTQRPMRVRASRGKSTGAFLAAIPREKADRFAKALVEKAALSIAMERERDSEMAAHEAICKAKGE